MANEELLREDLALLTLALEAAREALWCLDDVEDIEIWRKCVRNMAIMEITCILDMVVLDPKNIPKWKPSSANATQQRRAKIEKLKHALGIPTFWTGEGESVDYYSPAK